MVLNYIKRLAGLLSTERGDYANITFQLQKQILKKRYAEGKQDKSYKNRLKFNRSIVHYNNLAIKDNKNVIFLKKMV
jgi:hypothetical protein